MNDDEDEEEEEQELIPEKDIKSNNILSEEEKLDCIDMTSYKERINNILGTKYSHYFFQCFDFVYKKKEVYKITSILSDFLTKANRKGDSSWMIVYKSIKLYSSKNLPIIVNKYLHQKAEVEYKYILNESKKYTPHSSKFIEVYIRKMKNFNKKKMQESNKIYNEDIFEEKSKIRLKTFLSKKTIINRNFFKMQSLKKLGKIFSKNDVNDDALREKEIKEKQMRHKEIKKQIHRLRINSMKEIEKSNNLQTKQKKKYGNIKSRYLDIFNNISDKDKNSCIKLFNNNRNYNSSRKLFIDKNGKKNDILRGLNFRRNKTTTNEFDINYNLENYFLSANKSKDRQQTLRRNRIFLNTNAFKDYEKFSNMLTIKHDKIYNYKKSKKCDIQRVDSLYNDIINSEEYDRKHQTKKNSKLFLKAPIHKKERPKSSYNLREKKYVKSIPNKKNIKNKNNDFLLKNFGFGNEPRNFMYLNY